MARRKQTMNTVEPVFNEGRQKAFAALMETLGEHQGKPNVTERDFQDSWKQRRQSKGSITADGWYAPPPKGMAVLSGEIAFPSRVSFESLRKEKYWPSDRVINWKSDLLYVYCSPVQIPSGFPGDFSVTLYF